MKVNLPDNKKFNVSILPIDAQGQPAEVENVQWSVSDPSVASVLSAPDGLSAYVISGNLGTAQITVSADALIGDGIEVISDVLEVTVIGGKAVGFAFSVGEFQDK